MKRNYISCSGFGISLYQKKVWPLRIWNLLGIVLDCYFLLPVQDILTFFLLGSIILRTDMKLWDIFNWCHGNNLDLFISAQFVFVSLNMRFNVLGAPNRLSETNVMKPYWFESNRTRYTTSLDGSSKFMGGKGRCRVLRLSRALYQHQKTGNC